MSYYDEQDPDWVSESAEEYPRRHKKDQALTRQPNWLDQIINVDLDRSMKQPLFEAIRECVSNESGVDISYIVWSIAVLLPMYRYSHSALEWAFNNCTNSIQLDPRDALSTELLGWIGKQRSSRLLGCLPVFEHLEWEDQRGSSFFFFRGIPFLLGRSPNFDDYNPRLTLRCIWGSSEPIRDLLLEAGKDKKFKNKILKLHNVRSDKTDELTARKRPLHTIDMEPSSMKELVTDLDGFFDDKTETFYFENGVPYRRGYLFYGPPGTGKTSLSKAIASKYDLPLFVFDLSGMNDLKFQTEFKKLPKQKFCLDRKGLPQKAIDEFPKFLEEKRNGKLEFQYDIHRDQPDSGKDEEGMEGLDDFTYEGYEQGPSFTVPEASEHSPTLDEKAPESSSSESDKILLEEKSSSVSGSDKISLGKDSCSVSGSGYRYASPTHDDFADEDLDIDLAYGTYYPAQDRALDRPEEKIKGKLRNWAFSSLNNIFGLHGDVSVPEEKDATPIPCASRPPALGNFSGVPKGRLEVPLETSATKHSVGVNVTGKVKTFDDSLGKTQTKDKVVRADEDEGQEIAPSQEEDSDAFYTPDSSVGKADSILERDSDQTSGGR
ncbi:hypothetical protein BDV95DRAFT_597556 [Massariosphaeria phaeospora]|uniref:BCS1 N-terminal domain-containing protein n=1 Tax=Massariosphaeria phaeospora TaxID=100035 RepID=A0A7C8I682_9PLEO|nr:hypothetical protein BDV95DRAFT_597556 [Massariosphaeria phaeospora]